jgi:hypothetical protein
MIVTRVSSQTTSALMTRTQIDTGYVMIINSVPGLNANTYVQYNRPSFSGAWIFITVTSMNAMISTKMNYMAYINSQTLTNFNI